MRQLVLVVLCFAVPHASFGQSDIFADPTNIQVLDKDIPPGTLRVAMRSYAQALGVRCENCHVGEPGQPLTTFDFAADDKPEKETARQMIRMVSMINRDFVGEIDSDAERVSCITCHRGVARPKTTAREIEIALEKGGVDSAVERYESLRAQYHGTHSYDFSESALGDYAQRLVRNDQPEAALRLLELNGRYFPESFQNRYLEGEALIAMGDNGRAADRWRSALELDADPRFKQYVQQKLDALD